MGSETSRSSAPAGQQLDRAAGANQEPGAGAGAARSRARGRRPASRSRSRTRPRASAERRDVAKARRSPPRSGFQQVGGRAEPQPPRRRCIAQPAREPTGGSSRARARNRRGARGPPASRRPTTRRPSSIAVHASNRSDARRDTLPAYGPRARRRRRVPQRISSASTVAPIDASSLDDEQVDSPVAGSWTTIRSHPPPSPDRHAPAGDPARSGQLHEGRIYEAARVAAPRRGRGVRPCTRVSTRAEPLPTQAERRDQLHAHPTTRGGAILAGRGGSASRVSNTIAHPELPVTDLPRSGAAFTIASDHASRRRCAVARRRSDDADLGHEESTWYLAHAVDLCVSPLTAGPLDVGGRRPRFRTDISTEARSLRRRRFRSGSAMAVHQLHAGCYPADAAGPSGSTRRLGLHGEATKRPRRRRHGR